jgi:hypothetical protein
MKPARIIYAVLLFAAEVVSAPRRADSAEPLPSWNDTASKRAIMAFVEKVSKTGAKDFVPKAERIAVFDNDGTLWAKQPMYFQAFFIFDRIKQLAPQHSFCRFTNPRLCRICPL